MRAYLLQYHVIFDCAMTKDHSNPHCPIYNCVYGRSETMTLWLIKTTSLNVAIDRSPLWLYKLRPQSNAHPRQKMYNSSPLRGIFPNATWFPWQHAHIMLADSRPGNTAQTGEYSCQHTCRLQGTDVSLDSWESGVQITVIMAHLNWNVHKH